MSIDQKFVEWLDNNGYHPRSSKPSDYLSELIIEDLLEQCPLMRERASRGELVVKLRHHQQVNFNDWVIDIAFGTCAGKPTPPIVPSIWFTEPAVIQVAIELKTIMTEHGKARKNRLRDFQAFHAYAHQYHQKTVAAAFLIVNSAEWFWSPLRKDADVTRHGTGKHTAREVARGAIDTFRTISLRNSENDPSGLEAIGVIAVEHDNLKVHPKPETVADRHKPSRVPPVPPSLPVGDPLHYQTMIQRICAAYGQRFA